MSFKAVLQCRIASPLMEEETSMRNDISKGSRSVRSTTFWLATTVESLFDPCVFAACSEYGGGLIFFLWENTHWSPFLHSPLTKNLHDGWVNLHKLALYLHPFGLSKCGQRGWVNLHCDAVLAQLGWYLQSMFETCRWVLMVLNGVSYWGLLLLLLLLLLCYCC